MTTPPEILAPAGDAPAFLAALAAGADAIYVGLKHFSARMQAGNFSVKELANLTELARKKDCKVYVALNSLLKPGDVDAAGRLIDRLQRHVKPAALIVQDPGVLDLARQAGFAGELHVSTLANASDPASLAVLHGLGASRVVAPRELTVDELKTMAEACPPGLDLEVFVHGALCFCVSGRCYWSSLMGGKSGLRGRCVQPCRRTYLQKARKERYFSCLDLSLDVLVKALLRIERVRAWKIEGRKKGPHYVYHTVAAYKLLRDEPEDPKAKKVALDILSMALGRPGTHYSFLPQRPHSPVAGREEGPPTGSGLLASKITRTPEGGSCIKPRFELFNGDLLRVGYEDESWHDIVKIRKRVPKGGRLDLPHPKHKTPPAGAPVFLVDRREPELGRRVGVLQQELDGLSLSASERSDFAPSLPKPWVPAKGSKAMGDVYLMRALPSGKAGKREGSVGLWLSPSSLKTVSRTLYPKMWWWLPPVIWPDEAESWSGLLSRMRRDGAKRFVCNSPWQIGLFGEREGLSLMAGPFCNTANALALDLLRRLGFSSAVVSPELSGDELLALPKESPLPLGLVLDGAWPAGISRVKPEIVKPDELLQSPKGEAFYTRIYGENLWVYPAWPLDLAKHRPELEQAGYAFFIHMAEPRPKAIDPDKVRPGVFNWEVGLL